MTAPNTIRQQQRVVRPAHWPPPSKMAKLQGSLNAEKFISKMRSRELVRQQTYIVRLALENVRLGGSVGIEVLRKYHPITLRGIFWYLDKYPPNEPRKSHEPDPHSVNRKKASKP